MQILASTAFFIPTGYHANQLCHCSLFLLYSFQVSIHNIFIYFFAHSTISNICLLVKDKLPILISNTPFGIPAENRTRISGLKARQPNRWSTGTLMISLTFIIYIYLFFCFPLLLDKSISYFIEWVSQLSYYPFKSTW